ncbi:hypothetical protein AOB46_05440 [Chryseobacterium indologenes]|uniref:Uncharacterized protein n=1 Tax=Chryseobacterium indologenes TaxID=253 RepID=A0A0N0ZY68_CHRID|nr:hypothetical protein AOB46_05440 [Chryseobacterium indologenes]
MLKFYYKNQYSANNINNLFINTLFLIKIFLNYYSLCYWIYFIRMSLYYKYYYFYEDFKGLPLPVSGFKI